MRLQKSVSGGFLSITLLVCISCSRENPSVSRNAPATGTDSLHLLTWKNYVAPPLADKFRLEYGIDLVLEEYSSSYEMAGRMKTFPYRYDLAIFDSTCLPVLTRQGLLQPLDRDRLSGLANLDNELLSSGEDPERKLSVPFHWGVTLVAYRKDKVVKPEYSITSLFLPRYRGHAALIDDVYETFAAAHLAQERPANSCSPYALRSATSFLRAKVERSALDFLSPADVRQGLISGDLWISQCYSGNAASLARENNAVGYFMPEEGSPLFFDVLAISRDAPNTDLAYKFLTFLLEPENIAINSNYYLLPNALPESKPFLSEELLSDRALFPSKEDLEKCQFLKPYPLKTQTTLSRAYRELVNRSRSIASEEGAVVSLEHETF